MSKSLIARNPSGWLERNRALQTFNQWLEGIIAVLIAFAGIGLLFMACFALVNIYMPQIKTFFRSLNYLFFGW